MLDPSLDTPERMYTILDFWERAAMAYRGDGTRQAWDTGTATPYDRDVVRSLLDGVRHGRRRRSGRASRSSTRRLVTYLFLLYFDTRAGYCDTGPYEVPGHAGRTLLVRDFYRLSQSDFWWSDVAADVPYQNLTAAFVLDGVDFTRHRLRHVEPRAGRLPRSCRRASALFTTDGCAPSELQQVPLDEIDAIVTAVRDAQAQHYRHIAAMARDEKIRCGAYVYFSFLRPFALEAGIADELDWTVPRDLPDVAYQLMSAMEGDNTAGIDEDPYYEPVTP